MSNVCGGWQNTDHLQTPTRRLADLLTIHGLDNKIGTNYSRISWQTTDLQFTDLTKHGPINHGLDKARNVIQITDATYDIWKQ